MLFVQVIVVFFLCHQLSLTTKEVQVAFVNEIEGAHVPMLLVRSSVAGKVSDWSAQVYYNYTVMKLIDRNKQCKLGKKITERHLTLYDF